MAQGNVCGEDDAWDVDDKFEDGETITMGDGRFGSRCYEEGSFSTIIDAGNTHNGTRIGKWKM